MRIKGKYIAIPPGESIKEQLEMRSMTQKEFALRMGISEKHISRLITGQVELTQDVALRLESVFGIEASFWNNLEAIYREKLTRIIAAEKIEEEIAIARNFPYAKMASSGWVEPTRNEYEKVQNLRRFFEVANLENQFKLHTFSVAFRRTNLDAKHEYSWLAWVQKVKLEARKINTAKVDLKKIETLWEPMRKFTFKNSNEFLEPLTDLLAQCGIAFVVVPQIDGSYLHGGTFQNGPQIIVGMTMRNKTNDVFWFSLFHEIAHIQLGHWNSEEIREETMEEDANSIAANHLIDPHEYTKLIEKNEINRDRILTYSNRWGIAPGILVGRLQKEKRVPYNQLNDLKLMLE